MARYAHLSMYKTAMDLTVYLEQVVQGWPTSLAEKFRRAQWRFRAGIYLNRPEPARPYGRVEDGPPAAAPDLSRATSPAYDEARST